MDVDKDYYGILGVPPAAGLRELKAAFRALVKQYHPDMAATPAPAPGAEARFHEVNEAYRVLSNAQTRRAYDLARAAAVAAAERPALTLSLDQDMSAPFEFSDTEIDALADAAAAEPD